MKTSSLVSILCFAGAALLAASGPVAARQTLPAPPPPLPVASGLPADEAAARFGAATGIRDYSVVVMRGEQLLYIHHAGSHGEATRLPIASASKWMVGATIMALVDEGLLDLEAPISRYVPDLPEDYGALRLSQLLSYTAGLPSLAKFVEFKQPETISLMRSAQLAARTPLASAPGTQFDYGGANLQFLGAAAEQVTGKRWQAIFDERIGKPLGMRATLWGGIRAEPRPDALPANPMLQGGAWTTLADHMAFVTMIAQDGRYRGKAVLSPAAVKAMGRIMTLGLRKGFTAPGAQERDVEYMIAHWCERRTDARCTFESSPGLFGTYPWVDRETGLHGVIFLKDKLRRVAAEERALRDRLIAIYR